jgi:hypothetical protein
MIRSNNSNKREAPTNWPVAIDSRLLTHDTKRILHSSLRPVGRGTLTIGAQLADADGASEWVVAKIHGPEVARMSEAEVIRKARETSKPDPDPDIADHLPTVLTSDDFEHQAGAIRLALGLEGS